MRENVGSLDSTVRALVGPGLMFYGVRDMFRSGPGLTNIVALGFGAMLTETALTKVCPLNAALGIDTREFGKPRHLPVRPRPPLSGDTPEARMHSDRDEPSRNFATNDAEWMRTHSTGARNANV